MTDSKFIPGAGRLLIFQDEDNNKERVLDSGIILPKHTSEPTSSGVVVAVGDDVFEYTERNRVLFSPYSGYSVQIDDTLYILINENEVLGTFSGEVKAHVR